MCWWEMTISSRSSTRRPCAASARSSASSAVPEFGPLSTSVSGSSSMRYVLTRPIRNGVGIGRQWMPASAARASARGGAPPAVAHERMMSSTSSRRRSMSSMEFSDSRHRRMSGSVFEVRTLKCQSS